MEGRKEGWKEERKEGRKGGRKEGTVEGRKVTRKEGSTFLRLSSFFEVIFHFLRLEVI